MADYKISKVWNDVSDIHHITVDYDGYSYTVIFGKYINGGFFSIPNFNAGGDLGEFSEVSWNTESIYNSLKDENAAKAIAKAIKEYYVSIQD